MLGFSPCGFVFSNCNSAAAKAESKLAICARLKSCPDTIDSLKAILQEAPGTASCLGWLVKLGQPAHGQGNYIPPRLAGGTIPFIRR